MPPLKITKIFAVLTTLIGAMVMAGWFLELPLLTSILPQFVTMKFTTAFAFFLSGFIVYFVARYLEGEVDWADIVIPICSLTVLLLMVTLLASIFFNIRTGIEDLFVQEGGGALRTDVPGRPSAGTMLAFILVPFSGLLTIFRPASLRKKLYWLGIVTIAIGGVAVLGYIVSIPILYYEVKGWSSAMAIHTAVLFIFLGVGIFFSGRSSGNNNLS